jgi:hypothetical protein
VRRLLQARVEPAMHESLSDDHWDRDGLPETCL